MSEQNEINIFSDEARIISQTDWDSFETSWDFQRHPMLQDTTSAETAYQNWRDFTAEQFSQLHANEEALNRIFIEIYGLGEELTPEVSPKDITITKIVDKKEDKISGNAYSMDKKQAVETFVSYAVGCMFGRYSLDTDGLAFAGGDWDSSKYQTFLPTEDNIILITENDTGQKDIVSLFSSFVEAVYGKENVEDNLAFIADSLDNRRGTSREKIRTYFYSEFYKDHVRRYQRTPIYWQFDSGRAGGFRGLMYLHRYDKNTLGKARLNYLHPLQSAYESLISTNESILSHSSDTREKNQREKENEPFAKKLTECKTFDAHLHHLAPLGIQLDLDDGVETNHVKLQTDRDNNLHKILSDRRG